MPEALKKDGRLQLFKAIALMRLKKFGEASDTNLIYKHR